MSFNPRISVITVVYNDVAHIGETIESVLNQVYSNIEYIVIDGASKDGTAEVISRYADRLAYWVSEKDRGISDAMNKGVRQATGEYVYFLNSGDFLHDPHAFSEFFAKVKKDADILYGGFIGNFSGRPVLCEAPMVEHVTQRAWQGMQVCHSTLFVKRYLFDQYPFSVGRTVSLDVEFMARCVAGGATFERVEQTLFKVGFQGNSADHWLRGRVENWAISRKYFPGLKTDLYHAQAMARDVLFRTWKWCMQRLGIYALLQRVYHRYFRKHFSFLPKHVKPLD